MKRISHQDFNKSSLKEYKSVLDKAHIVIPARNEQRTIPATISYLFFKLKIGKDRIHVVENNSDDRTYDFAKLTNCCLVYSFEECFSRVKKQIAKVFPYVNLKKTGKGIAIFAGLLKLLELDLQDDTPIFFLDADIQNIEHINPVGRLAYAWNYLENTGTKLIKLASQGRNNEAIHAFLSIASKYRKIGEFQWPLCGQIITDWGTLKQLRMTTGYTMETAILMQLCELYGKQDIFGEVEIKKHLQDDQNTEEKHVRMFAKIMTFMLPFLQSLSLSNSPLNECIERCTKETALFVPKKKLSTFEILENDSFLPSLNELIMAI